MRLINFAKKDKFLSFMVLIAVTILLSLGMWQIYRLKQKNEFVQSVMLSLKNDPEQLNEQTELELYKKIYFRGKIDSENILWLYRRHKMAKNIDGAYLVAPIKFYDKTILALLGWFRSEDHKKIEEMVKTYDEVNFTALVLEGERASFIIPSNDYKNKLIFTLDIEDIAKNLGIKLQNNFLASLETELEIQKLGLKISEDMMLKIRNDHFEYAATWFCLAIGLIYIYFIYMNRKYKNDDN